MSKSGGEARIGFSNGDTGRLPASSAGMRYRKTGGSAFAAMRPGQLIVIKSTGGDRYALRNIPEVSGGMIVESPHSGRIYAMQGGFDVRMSSRSEEHTSELQSLMRISYAVFCLTKKKYTQITHMNKKE